MPEYRDDIPDILRKGDPKAVAAFLFENLAVSQTPDPATVAEWSQTLWDRGSGFGNAVATCRYWLYLHSDAAPDHEQPFRLSRKRAEP